MKHVPYLIVRFWGDRCQKEMCNPNPCKDTLSFGLQSKMMLKMSATRQQVANKLNSTRMENDYVCKPYSQEKKIKRQNLNSNAAYDMYLNDLLSGTGVVPGRRL